jgi:ABC-type lipoprotein release transport system permease subunit
MKIKNKNKNKKFSSRQIIKIGDLLQKQLFVEIGDEIKVKSFKNFTRKKKRLELVFKIV